MVLQHPITKAISTLTFALVSISPLAAPARAVATASAGEAPPVDPRSVEAPRRPGGASSPDATCPRGMLLVDGDACADAEQTCLRWLDPPPYQNLRCAEYAPSRCKSTRARMRFCIDRDEAVEPAREGAPQLPVVGTTWTAARAACEARGARLCRESEWQFACEGPSMSPYPYGSRREPGACNVDRTDLGGMNDKLIDHRAQPGSFPRCTSPFGVRDMTGNVDEWTEREGAAAPYRSALRGGWWLPGRNRCRAATLGHDEGYAAKQVGYRCCSDAAP